jgi:succinyl-CoA synthetase beta subunit
MASTEGGVEIEKVAEETPHLIHKIAIDPLAGPMPYQGRELAFKLGLEETGSAVHHLYGSGDHFP